MEEENVMDKAMSLLESQANMGQRMQLMSIAVNLTKTSLQTKTSAEETVKRFSEIVERLKG